MECLLNVQTSVNAVHIASTILPTCHFIDTSCMFCLLAAVLAAGFPEVAPFMADEAVEAVCGGGKVEYTLKAYLDYAHRLTSMVVDLNELRGWLFGQ